MPYNWSLRDATAYWHSRLTLWFGHHRQTSPAVGTHNVQEHTDFFPSTIVGHIRFWIVFLSWAVCSLCSSILPQPVLPNYSRRFKSTRSLACPCLTSPYVVPQPHQIPEVLAVLLPSDLIILRPFTIDLGRYERKQYDKRYELLSLGTEQGKFRSLADKAFSPAYWQWQHRYLLDVVRQKGYPPLFITISSSEWTFTLPSWLHTIKDRYSVGPTQTPFHETMHFLHVLEQVVRGYMCGTNNQRWHTHLFNCNDQHSQTSIDTYFYRFEFQSRGTVHMHLLVWLKSIRDIQYDRIRADFPPPGTPLHTYVQRHQLSNAASLSLSIQDTPTYVQTTTNIDTLHIVHPADAFALNLRAYIDTLLPSLCCSMDVQTSDGHGMILRYVTSYVSKRKESFHKDSLFVTDVNASHAAFRYLINLRVCEPEMWSLLSGLKLSYCYGTTAKFVVPTPDTISDNTLVQQYYRHCCDEHTLSLLQWLRNYHTSSKKSRSSTLPVFIGLQFLSLYNPLYFFQLLLLYHPHTSTDVILPDTSQSHLPPQVTYFQRAMQLIPHFFHPDAFQKTLEAEGHKNSYIRTALSYLQSLKDLLIAHSLHVLPPLSCPYTVDSDHNSSSSLQGQQLAIFHTFKLFLPARTEYYTSGRQVDINWKQFILITGPPGSGKSFVLRACIEYAIDHHYSVSVATPTGALACFYKDLYPSQLTSDTIHSLFHITVSPFDTYSINWTIAFTDILIIDEISQISVPIFNHILTTVNVLPVRPIVLLCGNFAQQQPLATIDGSIRQVPSIVHHPFIVSSCYTVNPTSQYRIHDNFLLSFLHHIRYYRPTPDLLATLQHDRVLSTADIVTETIIQSIFHHHPTYFFLTISSAASDFINTSIMSSQSHSLPSCTVHCTPDLLSVPLYNGLPIMLLENRDKSNGFVNGQLCTVHSVQGGTVLAHHPHGHIINIYPITSSTSTSIYYPFGPAYSSTVAKVQGQTLNNVILWVDTQTTPPGTCYVALSRVRTIDNLLFLTELYEHQFIPVL